MWALLPTAFGVPVDTASSLARHSPLRLALVAPGFRARDSCPDGCKVVVNDLNIAVHGDPMFKVNGTGTHFWLAEGQLTSVLQWAARDRTAMSLSGRTMAQQETKSQWFDSFVIKEGTAPVLEVAAGDGFLSVKVNGAKPLALKEGTSGAGKEVRVTVSSDGPAQKVGRLLSIEAGGLRMRMFASRAAKLAGKDKTKFTHLNLHIDSSIPKDATGIFAELAGVRPMSAATSALIRTRRADLDVAMVSALVASRSNVAVCPEGCEAIEDVHGWKERLERATTLAKAREPSRDDLVCYAARYPDLIAEVGQDTEALLRHWKEFGASEGRDLYCATGQAAPEPTQPRVAIADVLGSDNHQKTVTSHTGSDFPKSKEGNIETAYQTSSVVCAWTKNALEETKNKKTPASDLKGKGFQLPMAMEQSFTFRIEGDLAKEKVGAETAYLHGFSDFELHWLRREFAMNFGGKVGDATMTGETCVPGAVLIYEGFGNPNTLGDPVCTQQFAWDAATIPYGRETEVSWDGFCLDQPCPLDLSKSYMVDIVFAYGKGSEYVSTFQAELAQYKTEAPYEYIASDAYKRGPCTADEPLPIDVYSRAQDGHNAARDDPAFGKHAAHALQLVLDSSPTNPMTCKAAETRPAVCPPAVRTRRRWNRNKAQQDLKSWMKSHEDVVKDVELDVGELYRDFSSPAPSASLLARYF